MFGLYHKDSEPESKIEKEMKALKDQAPTYADQLYQQLKSLPFVADSFYDGAQIEIGIGDRPTHGTLFINVYADNTWTDIIWRNQSAHCLASIDLTKLTLQDCLKIDSIINHYLQARQRSLQKMYTIQISSGKNGYFNLKRLDPNQFVVSDKTPSKAKSETFTEI